MMMLLALPQPGPPMREPVSLADAAWSWSNEPRLMPRSPEPPTRRMSRRVTPRCRSHRSLPADPGTMNIANPLSTSHSAIRLDASPTAVSSHARYAGRRFQSMVKQERRAVDQRPGDVLGGGQALVGQLLDAHGGVVAELGKARVDGDRLADLGQLVAEVLQLGVDRQ